MAKDETKITQDDVEKEHLRDVKAGAQAAYLLTVIVGSFVLMVAFIAVLGATGGG